MRQIHLWREEAIESDGLTTVSVTIELSNQGRSRLWYRVPSEYGELLTPSCDPFVVATIFLAMSKRADMVVHGEASPSLLQNLAEFQAAWRAWRPYHYGQIEIAAEVEREASQTGDKAIAAFSGGVDSCFTVFRHQRGRCGRFQRHVKAGLMIHGFDIPLEQQQVFSVAAEKSKKMLASLGVELIPMATNFREIKQDWEDAFGAGTASCLMLLQGGFTAGLVGSSDPYIALNLPYGSNPITDHLLSSRAFQIVCDGASFTRLEKVKEIADWPEALQNLRVCWQGAQKDRNCGQCEKCIRTILGFRVLGLDLPSCFEQDVTDQQILGIRGLTAIQRYDLELILEAAKGSVSGSWVTALEQCIYRNRQEGAKSDKWAALKQSLPPSLRKPLRSLRSRLFSK